MDRIIIMDCLKNNTFSIDVQMKGWCHQLQTTNICTDLHSNIVLLKVINCDIKDSFSVKSVSKS